MQELPLDVGFKGPFQMGANPASRRPRNIPDTLCNTEFKKKDSLHCELCLWF